MRLLTAITIAASLAGCGVDTATTAATVAVARKHEAEQGRNTVDQVRQKIGAAAEQSAERSAGAAR